MTKAPQAAARRRGIAAVDRTTSVPVRAYFAHPNVSVVIHPEPVGWHSQAIRNRPVRAPDDRPVATGRVISRNIPAAFLCFVMIIIKCW
jgi:hypothetical protein